MENTVTFPNILIIEHNSKYLNSWTYFIWIMYQTTSQIFLICPVCICIFKFLFVHLEIHRHLYFLWWYLLLFIVSTEISMKMKILSCDLANVFALILGESICSDTRYFKFKALKYNWFYNNIFSPRHVKWFL